MDQALCAHSHRHHQDGYYSEKLCPSLEIPMRTALLIACLSLTVHAADPTDVYPPGEVPSDSRLAETRTLNSYFPFQSVGSPDEWRTRQAKIRRRLLVSQGLWPEPTKSPLNAVIHSRVEFDDYTVECVYFESIPGHFVTGSLYRPRGAGPYPAVLCPHGHWQDARFYDAGEAEAQKLISSGGEELSNAARNHLITWTHHTTGALWVFRRSYDCRI
jgi:hypothetical protein